MNRRAAFTLVEALVAVAILAALLLLALPMVGRIRAKTNAARCAANLKAIGMGVAAYESDHRGQFPPSRLQYRMDKDGTKTTVSFLPDLLKKEYLPLNDLETLWWCPGDLERPKEMRKHSYGHNQRLGGNLATPLTWDHQPNPNYKAPYAALQNVAVPLSRVIFLIDYVDKEDAGKWSSAVVASRWPLNKGAVESNPPATRIDFQRHPPVANALFLDGSVRGLTFQDLAGTESFHIAPAPE